MRIERLTSMGDLPRRRFLSLAMGVAACEATPNVPISQSVGITESAVAMPTPLPPEPKTPNPVAARVRLLDAFPRLAELAPLRLFDGMTPIVEVPALARALSVGELWLKRDDLSSDLFGGGKVRKLEWFLGDARREGRVALITFGGVGSNHAVAVAAFGRRHGFHVVVELAPQPKSEVTARQLRDCANFGAEIRASTSVSVAFDRARRAGRGHPDAPYVVPPGGTSPLGDLGFVEAGLELARQIRGGARRPDVIVMATGTMGSAAGLAIGLGAANLEIPIRAVRCSSRAASSPEGMAKRIDETRAFMRERGATLGEVARITFEDRFLGEGYGHPTKEGRHAMEIAERTTGFAFEPIYTGKALAALPAMKLEERCVLFWMSQPGPTRTPMGTPSDIPPSLRAYL